MAFSNPTLAVNVATEGCRHWFIPSARPHNEIRVII